MKKTLLQVGKWCAILVICSVALMSVAIFGYGLYQQSQLYPRVHQDMGYQKCVVEVNNEIAQQRALQNNQQLNEQVE